MSVFAATTGVDPQTGSYLSAEQRVAMFKGATGRSGFAGRSGGGGGTAGGGAGRAQVAPQNSIVVVNKLNKISQNLQTNFTTATENVAAQVAQNRKDIENLYSFVNKRQEQELRNEKADTKQKLLAAQQARFSMREKLVEGLSGAAAKAASTAKDIAQTASQPIMGFLERLKNALVLLAGAWLVQNLPSILNDLEYAFDNFDDTRKELTKQLLNQRGWASGVDVLLRNIFKGLRGLGTRMWSFARWIGGKTLNIITRVFTSIKNFSTRVVNGIVTRLGSIWNKILGKLKDALPEPAKQLGRKLLNSAPVKAVTGVVKGATDYFGGIVKSGLKGDFKGATSKAFKPFGDAFDGLKNFVGKQFDAPITKYAESQGVQQQTPAQRTSGLKKLFKPITDALGKIGLPKGMIQKLFGTLGKLPIVGTIVDISLNKAGGLPWMDSIINGIASSIGGMVGWKAGASLGFAAGSVLPGPGNAIGAVLGGILGSVIGGWVTEKAAQGVFGTADRPETPDSVVQPVS